MPSTDHELPLELIRTEPQLVPTILRSVFGLDLPGDKARLCSESFAGLNPAELRCDATVILDDAQKPGHGIIVESQTRYDKNKLFSWPAYLALLRHRHKCGATLLILCRNQADARRFAEPIDMGHPGWVLRPLAFHPGMLPPVTDPDQARRFPELAILSSPAHADGPYAETVVTSVAAAIDSLGGDTRDLYHDYVTARFSDAARKLLEEIVKTADYKWESDFAKNHIAMGEAKMLLKVLEARGIAVPNDVRERVTSCTDTDQLERWVQRAVVIDKAEDLLD